MKNFILFTISILVNLLHFATTNAQTQPKVFDVKNIIPTSPDAAILGRFGDIPVGLYTGTAQVSIPLYTIRSGGFELPLILNYHSSGIKVQDDASIVGLGWSFDPAGSIVCSVQGTPDFLDNFFDTNAASDYYNFKQQMPQAVQYSRSTIGASAWPCIQEQAPNPAQYEDSYSRMTTLLKGGGQPDIYYYNFAGYSGKFYINPETKQVVLIDKKSEINFSFNGYLSVIATTFDGNKFYFEALEKATSDGYDINSTSALTWRMTKIVLNNGKEINFEYSNGYYESVSCSETVSSKYPYSLNSSTGGVLQKVPHFSIHNILYLRRVITDDAIVEFNMEDREDLKGKADIDGIAGNGDWSVKRLKSVDIKQVATGNKIRSFNLSYGYFSYNSTGGNYLDDIPSAFKTLPEFQYTNVALGKRLRLDSVKEIGYNNGVAVEKPPYSFTYNSISLPLKTSYARDHWGYYNGKANTSFIPSLVPFSFGLYPGHESMPQNMINFFSSIITGSERAVDKTNMVAATLQGITYPTGGRNTFEYEANEFSNYNYPDMGGYNASKQTVSSEDRNVGPSFPYIGWTSTSFSLSASNTVHMYGMLNKGPNQFLTYNQLSSSSIKLTKINGNDVTVLKQWQLQPSDAALFNQQGYIEWEADIALPYEPGAEYWITTDLADGIGAQQTSSDYASATANVTYYAMPPSSTLVNYGGGLRIARIKNLDEGNNATKSKKFKYITENNISSGRLMSPLLYFHSAYMSFISGQGDIVGGQLDCARTAEDAWFISADSYIPLSDGAGGNVVGYSRVEEIEEDVINPQYGSNGKSVFYYHNEPSVTYAGNPPTADLLNGQVEKEEISDGYNLIRETSYSYTNIDYTISQGINSFTGYKILSTYAGPEACDFGDQTFPCLTYGGFPSKYTIFSYPIISQWNLKSGITTIYHEAGNTLTTSETYAYNPSGQLIRIDSYDSKYNLHSTQFSYAKDEPYSVEGQYLTAAGMFEDCIEIRDYVNSVEQSRTRNTYMLVPGQVVQSGVLKSFNSAAFTAEIEYQHYGSNRTLQQYSEKGLVNSLLWSEDKNFVIAKIVNASFTNVAYTSFEQGTKGNWLFDPNAVDNTMSLTGKSCYNLSGAGYAISKSGLSSAQSYIVSYWIKGSALSISGTQSGYPVQGRTVDGWTYYEHKVSGQSNVDIWGSGFIDELRLYPADAQMTTYTREPLIGMTSQTNLNSLTAYYEYDAFGRLILLRDQDKNIVRKIDYNYALQSLPGGKNYVRTFDAFAPEQNSLALVSRPVKDVRQTTQYINGLGRQLQTVVKQGALTTGSPATDWMKDVADYDGFERPYLQYLPFASSEANGEYKSDYYNDQGNFYGSLTNDGSAYVATAYLPSPLTRIYKVLPPGWSWVGDWTGTEFSYFINTSQDAVSMWSVSDNAQGETAYNFTGNYAEGQLFKNIKFDEENKQSVEYKDKLGRVVLKQAPGWLSTYYVYDDAGLLRLVIPPKASETLVINDNNLTADILNELCFQYKYDNRHRMIAKKVPGADWVYMVYDKRDRLVFMQDGNMRSNGAHRWSYNLYDCLNRAVQTGIIDDYTGSTQDLQNNVNANTGNNISTVLSYNGQYVNGVYYTSTFNVLDNAIPASVGTIPLTQTFYDRYDATGKTYNATLAGNVDPGNNLYYEVLPAQPSKLIKGMTTVSKVRVLDNLQNIAAGNWLETATFYDEKGRKIQVCDDNYKGGKDIMTTQYDWSSKVISAYLNHSITGTNNQTHEVLTKMGYDDLGRMISISKKLKSNINGVITERPETETVSYKYNAIGQLKQKQLAPYFNNNQGIETDVYQYNIRGWLSGVNKDYLSNSNSRSIQPYFGFALGYVDPLNDLGYTDGQMQYTGNISAMAWKSKGDNELRKYNFSYDDAYRLTGADFNQYTANSFNKSANIDFSVSNISYDANGNILTMDQMGLRGIGSTFIDKLQYQYQDNSNKLMKVTDNIYDPQSKPGDFKDGTNTGNDYNYDVNGNLIVDYNKDISSIAYNYLNLASNITVDNKGQVKYVYDAKGNKLQKIIIDNTVSPAKSIITDYVSDIVYEQINNDPAKLQYITHEEGRIRIIAAPANNYSYAYDYFLKDHLGNVRSVLTDEYKQDQYPAATLEDGALGVEKEYYSIDDANIVDKNSVTGFIYAANSDYHNNNGQPPFNTNNTSNVNTESQKLYKINGSSINKTGLGITLKVMAGDVMSVYGKSYYFQNNTDNNNNNRVPIEQLLIGMLGGGGSVGTSHNVVADDISGSNNNISAIADLLNGQQNGNNATPQKPRAYISYLLFDEQFKCVGTGTSQVGDNGILKDHNGDLNNITVAKNGYIYVYCSNESPVDVFFDNLQVIHTRSPLLEEAHYYPFGLTMAGISNKAAGSLSNKLKYNDKEEQRQEFSDGSGLELLDYGARMYDAQIGRWGTIDHSADNYLSFSPYSYVLNNPLNAVDPDGNDIYILIWFSKEKGKKGEEEETGHAGIAIDNYKEQIKTDGKGNPILDKDNKPVTEFVKDGTFTYYDLWPKDAVSPTSELQKNVTPDYSPGVKINNLSDLMNTDPTTHRSGNVSPEGRAADGIVKIQTTMQQDNAAKSKAEAEIKAKTKYNACDNNCSTFTQNVLNAAINPQINASQTITPSFPLNMMYKPATVVAPNNLYNAGMKIKGAQNIKGPGSVVALPYLKYFGK